MNILVFSQYYEPEPFLIHDKIKELVIKGHNVIVITGLPNYPKGSIYKDYTKGEHFIDGVKIIRLPIRPRMKGTVNLFLNYASFVLKASNYVKEMDGKFDAIYVYQLSPVLMAIPAIKVKKKYKIPIVLYCLDLWPESLVSGGIKKDSLIYHIFKLISKRIYKSIDLIEISSRSFEKYFVNTLNIKGKYIYNPQYAVDDSDNDIKTEIIFPNNKVNVTFTGNVGEIQGLEVAIKAMNFVEDNILLHIIGDGSKKSNLEALTKELSLEEKVKFHGRKPIEEMNSVMQNSDALLVTMKDDEVISYTLPAKVQSYLKSGKFILGSINGEAADVINESKAGLVTPAEDEVKLAKAINEFASKKTFYSQEGLNGIQYYQDNFGKDKFINTLINDLENVTLK